jgi:SAM-dependent methyltransferase
MGPEDWDERYAGDELLWRAEPNRFVVAETEDLEPGRALDFACGEGRNAVWLAEKGWTATGVDFSQVGLAKARRLADERGVVVEWIAADVREWQAPDSFDLVVVLYLHLPLDERRRAHRNAARSLAVGGTLLVVGHDLANLAKGIGGPRDPAVLFTPADVVDDLAGLEVAFDVEHAESVRRPVTTDHGEVDAIDALVRAVRSS